MTIASPRLIPLVLLSNRRIVKTTKFADPIYIGDPINTIQMFSDMGADEIIVINIDEKGNLESTDFDYLRQMADKCFCPLSYGGGIRDVTQAKELVKIGFEKICVKSAALLDKSFVRDLSLEIGSQSVVAAIDVIGGKVHVPRALRELISKEQPSNPMEWARELVEFGAGEVLLGDVELDGAMKGMNLGLISEVSSRIGVPLIALGGVGNMEDAVQGVNAGASAVAAGSLFVYSGKYKTVLINYPDQSEMIRYGFWPQ
jgi:cyclase